MSIARNQRLLDGVRRRSIAEPAFPRTPCSSAPRAASRGRPTRCATTATTRPPTSTSRSRSGCTGINRGILLPPGLDEQWLVSVLHTDADIDHHTQVYEDFVSALVA